MIDKPPLDQIQGSPTVEPGTQGRRRFLRGGLAAGPVVVASALPRSVMAGECTQASAFASVSGSRVDTMVACTGKTPDYWRDCSPTYWPSACQRSTTCTTAFGTSRAYSDRSLIQVLRLTDTTGNGAVARYLVAALLNAHKGLTPVADAAKVKTIWFDFFSKGYYEPTAGIRWYASSSQPAGAGGLLPWLQTTMA